MVRSTLNAVRILVCGGRDFRDTKMLDEVLSEIAFRFGIREIIHGGANGADTMAGCWGQKHNIPVLVYPADWKKHGRAAGPIRNQQMLDEGKPDWVVAFPGGRGTAHMVNIARKAGVTVFDAANGEWHG